MDQLKKKEDEEKDHEEEISKLRQILTYGSNMSQRYYGRKDSFMELAAREDGLLDDEKELVDQNELLQVADI